MALITLEEFQAYTNNFETDEDLVALKNDIMDAASDIVIDYLGYNPDCNQHHEIQVGIGSNKIFMAARPVTGVGRVTVDGEPLNIMNIMFKDDEIFTRDGSKLFKRDVPIVVDYVAGTHGVPSIIKTAVLRISALMWQETGGNIGLTGRNFADQSRSFLNYTNYQKYLEPLRYLKTRII